MILSRTTTILCVSTAPQRSSNNVTSSSSSSPSTTTPTPKYPTLRGTTVDARKIVKTGAARQHLKAIRLSHILFETRDLADASLHRLRSSEISFADLATQISACTETRDKGGALGWINVVPSKSSNSRDNGDAVASVSKGQSDASSNSATSSIDSGEEDSNEHLDLLFPKDARKQLVQITTKPGDVVMVESSIGYHIVQVVDIMADIRKMALRKQRKAKKGTSETNSQQPASAVSSPKTYQLESMGCQMNSADSERIEGQLQNLGIMPFAKDPTNKKDTSKPDVIVLNTCSIRDHAEQKVYSYIGPHAKRKRDGEDVTIVVAGCVAQQEGEALLRRAPEVDLVMGPQVRKTKGGIFVMHDILLAFSPRCMFFRCLTHPRVPTKKIQHYTYFQYANRIGDLLEDVANGNQVVATEATHIMEDSTKPRRQSTVAAWVNVIYGCNERCTFCIVPTTRGVEQSRPVEIIVAEITELVDQGYKEVTLLGQNIE